MTKEEILNVDVGDVLTWTPDFESPDLEGFKRSNQYSIFEEKDVVAFEITFIENQHGFSNSLSYEMRAIQSDGSFLSDFEYLHDEEQQKELLSTPEDRELIKPFQERVWVEVITETDFLNYLLSKGEKYFDLI